MKKEQWSCMTLHGEVDCYTGETREGRETRKLTKLRLLVCGWPLPRFPLLHPALHGTLPTPQAL